MRTSETIDRQDFEDALSYAIQGAVVSDTGLSDEVEAALDQVRRAAPNPPQNLIDAASAAFDASR